MSWVKYIDYVSNHKNYSEPNDQKMAVELGRESDGEIRRAKTL
jgi:hypothetical protein